MGGYKQATLQNYATGYNTAARKGKKKVNVNNNRTGLRVEINKKRLHDGILRYGILMMVLDIEGTFDLLKRSTSKLLFGKDRLRVANNDHIDTLCLLL